MKHRNKFTYCPRLWDEVYIDQNGNVYSCCHNKPVILGNIYKERLNDICNNTMIQEFRDKSLKGQLKCFKRCKLLDKEKIVVPEVVPLTINYSALKRLKILFGEACNINCIMCWQDSKSKLSLDYEKLIEHLDISPFESIEIQGGEPLFIKSAKNFFDYVASKNKKVSFLTNGILINDKWAEKIARYSTFVYFSLNAATKEMHEFINKGSKWERVLKNVQRIQNAREKLHTEVKIWGHMTIITKNLEEIPLFIKRFREFGFDAIDFGIDHRVPRYLKIHPWKKRFLKKQIEEAINQSEDRLLIDVHRLKLLGFV